MNKYKLINKQTGEEHLCEKVVIDGWDYYVSDDKGQVGDIVVEKYVDGTIGLEQIDTLNDIDLLLQKKVIATNNPDIDIPKIIDKAEMLAKEYCEYWEFNRILGSGSNGLAHDSFTSGYNKSQETHPYSDDDMVEFLNWIRDNTVFDSAPKPYHRKTQTRLSQEELLQLWKEQRTKILYYE